MPPLISIILPVYNPGKHLRPCLDSLKAQTLTDFEVLCVNDGSTDGSGKVLDEYAVADERFRVFHRTNHGPGASRNFGIEQARGTFLTLMDHDDWAEPEWLEKMHAALTDSQADFVIFQALEFKENERAFYVGPWNIPADIPVKKAISLDPKLRKKISAIFCEPWRKLVRLDFVREHKMRFAEGLMMDDVFFHVLLVHFARTFCFSHEYLYVHRQLDSSASCQVFRNPTQLIEYLWTVDQLAEFFREKPEEQKEVLENAFQYVVNPWVLMQIPHLAEYRRICRERIRKYHLPPKILPRRKPLKELERKIRHFIKPRLQILWSRKK